VDKSSERVGEKERRGDTWKKKENSHDATKRLSEKDRLMIA